MMSSPNASAKWSKYGVEDGKLVRKAEFCPTMWARSFPRSSQRPQIMWPLWIHSQD